MTKIIPTRKSKEWKMALDNLEQMHPRYLIDLVHQGTLTAVLKAKVERYFTTLMDLQRRMPGEPLDVLKELAQEELVPVNSGWQDEEPLSAEEKQLLKRYLAENKG